MSDSVKLIIPLLLISIFFHSAISAQSFLPKAAHRTGEVRDIELKIVKIRSQIRDAKIELETEKIERAANKLKARAMTTRLSVQAEKLFPNEIFNIEAILKCSTNAESVEATIQLFQIDTNKNP